MKRRKGEREKRRWCKQKRTAGMWEAGRSDVEERRGLEERGGVESRSDGMRQGMSKGRKCEDK